MALANTNISVSLVKSTLGESATNVAGLCLSALVNKYSKYKPVIGTFPVSTNNKYGLDLPVWNNAAGTFSGETWNYLKPSTEFRLGDFRGYENNGSLTYPAGYCIATEQDENPVLSPSQPSGGYSSGTVQARFNTNSGSVRPTISEMGLSAFYFGILVITPSGGKWIKTNPTTLNTNLESSGLSIVYSAALNDPTSQSSTYQNLPYGIGNYTAYYIISNTNYAVWTQNPGNVIYRLPSDILSGITFKSSYVFNVKDWVFTAENSLWFAYPDNNSTHYKAARVYMSAGAEPFTVNIQDVSWVEFTVYAADGVTNITNSPTLWGHGGYVRFFPIDANNGTAKEGLALIQGTNCTPFPISLTHQAAAASVHVYAGNSSVLTVSNTSGNVINSLNVTFTPNYSAGGDPSYNVAYVIKVNGVATYSSYTAGLACTNNQSKTASLSYGTTTWVDGDVIDVYMYHNVAPNLA